MRGLQYKQMGEHIGQRKTQIIAIKRYQVYYLIRQTRVLKKS